MHKDHQHILLMNAKDNLGQNMTIIKWEENKGHVACDPQRHKERR